MTILNTIYNHIIEECVQCKALYSEKNPDRIRLGTIQTYTVRDNLKFVASTSDFPCMEIRQIALAEHQAHSGGVVLRATWQVTVATGVFDYETRLFPLELAMLGIASRLKRWRWHDSDNPKDRMIGATISPITIGRLQRDGEPDSVKGWVLQFTYDVLFNLSNETMNTYFNK